MPAKKSKEPESAAVSCLRQATEEFVACADLLAQKHQDKTVHKLRRAGKKLRGALRVCGVPEETERRVRRICRVTGNARDALVLRQTWRGLEKTESAKEERAASRVVTSLLASQHKAAGHHFPKEMMQWLRAETDTVVKEVTAAAGEIRSAQVAQNFAKMRAQVAERLGELKAHSKEKKFHALRKRLKRMLGAVPAVEESPFSERMKKALTQLASLLGDEHDLTVLRDWLEAHASDASLLPSSHKTITRKISQLRRSIARKAAMLGKEVGGS